jgi:hypothetical protein
VQEIEEIYIDLIRKVYEKFTFFISMTVAEDENMIGIFHYMNLKLDDEFYDKYVDILLFCDDKMEVHEFVSYKEFMEFNGTKMLNLSNNCAKLAILKDTLGKTSFRYIFEKYTEQLVVLNYACDRLVHFFYEHYPENPADFTFLFRHQKLILQTHIKELENVILSKGKRIDEKAMMQRLVEMFLSLPAVRSHCSNNNSESSIENNESSNSITEYIPADITPLSDLINHEKKIEIALIIVEKYRNRKPKTIGLLMECLKELNLITLLRGESSNFIQALNLTFQNEKKLICKSIVGKKSQKMTTDYKSLKIELLKAISTYYK